jgi:hypothetical protein
MIRGFHQAPQKPCVLAAIGMCVGRGPRKTVMRKTMKRPSPAIDPTPDTTPHQRGQTDPARSMQSERAAGLKQDRARRKGELSNAGNVGRGQRGVSGVARRPATERRKRG